MQNLSSSILDPNNLSLVLDTLKLGIIVHTPDRIITVFNTEAERVTGYSRQEVIGKDCHDVFQEPFCGGKCSFCDGPPTFHPGEIKEYPLTIVTKSGETRHLEMTVCPIIDHGDTFQGVLASFNDITSTFDLSIKAENLSNFAGIIGKDKAMLDIFRQIQDVALYNYPVHVSGETGTGKERVALAIHDISAYGNGAFVPVNCGALPEGIVESELFGHVKGAFSGAIKERKGRFELAHKGTLFLDEVAELPLSTQVKLLRFLQEGSFEKVGGEKRVFVDVRIISATNKDLKEEVRKGTFREDLLYRLNVIPIHLPPLRERKSDIPLLITHFLEEAKQENQGPVARMAPEGVSILMDYHWPGNVRELKNIIQFAVVKSRGSQIRPTDLPRELLKDRDANAAVLAHYLPPEPEPDFDPDPALKIDGGRGKLGPEAVKAALAKTGGNKSKAARVLKVGRATLYRFLAQNEEVRAYAENFKKFP